MLACKGIFARPSIPQSCAAWGGDSYKGLRSKTFCGYYATISARPTMSGMVMMDSSVESDTMLPEECG